MKCNIINIGLVILLLFVMCFQFLPKLAHEAMGIVFCLGIVLHLYRNRGWLRNIRWQGTRMCNPAIRMGIWRTGLRLKTLSFSYMMRKNPLLLTS